MKTLKVLSWILQGLFLAVGFSPLFRVEYIFFALAIMNMLLLSMWGMLATADCQKYYQKGYIQIRREELPEYIRALKSKNAEICEKTPQCLKDYYSSSKAIHFFFISLIIWMFFREFVGIMSGA